MQRSVLLVGALLVAFGLGVFVWKTRGLDMPIIPSGEGPWRVELEITLRGEGQRGSVRAPLPSSGPGPVGLRRAHGLRGPALHDPHRGRRSASASGAGASSGVVRVVHGFRVQTERGARRAAAAAARGAAAEILRAPTPPRRTELPVHAAEIQAEIARLPLAEPARPGRARAHALRAGQRRDRRRRDAAATTPCSRWPRARAATRGRTLLFTTLLRAAGIPARVVQGLELRGRPRAPTQWSEAWIGDGWVPLSPAHGFFAERPEGLVALHTGARRGHRGDRLRGGRLALPRAAREPAPGRAGGDDGAAESAAGAPLALPAAGADAARAARAPAAAARRAAWWRSSATCVGVHDLRHLHAGAGRLRAARGAARTRARHGRGDRCCWRSCCAWLLERLRLLLVPRLSVLLCVVVLVDHRPGAARALSAAATSTSAVLFPIVILTMFVERFTLVMAEEGLRQALGRAAWTHARGRPPSTRSSTARCSST